MGISQLGLTHSGLSAASDLEKQRGRKTDVERVRSKTTGSEVVEYGERLAEMEG